MRVLIVAIVATVAYAMSVANAGAKQFTAISYHDGVPFTYSMDTNNADFSWEDSTYRYYAYRDWPVFAESKSSGSFHRRWGTGINLSDGRTPWAFNTQSMVATEPPDRCATPIIASKRVKVRNRNVSCFGAISVVKYFAVKKKDPPGWDCTHFKGKYNCTKPSDGSGGNGIILPPDEAARYEYASSRAMFWCGSARVPIRFSISVLGTSKESCSKLNHADLIMYIARGVLLGSLPHTPHSGFLSCTGDTNGHVSCVGTAGECVVIAMSNNTGWFGHYVDQRGEFYYKNSNYAGC